MKQKELEKFDVIHAFDCWEDFDLSNKSIYNRILSNKIVIAKALINEIKCFFEEKGIYEIMPDFDVKKHYYSEKCRNKKFQKFCAYFRQYIEYWNQAKIESPSLECYVKNGTRI